MSQRDRTSLCFNQGGNGRALSRVAYTTLLTMYRFSDVLLTPYLREGAQKSVSPSIVLPQDFFDQSPCDLYSSNPWQ